MRVTVEAWLLSDQVSVDRPEHYNLWLRRGLFSTFVSIWLLALSSEHLPIVLYCDNVTAAHTKTVERVRPKERFKLRQKPRRLGHAW